MAARSSLDAAQLWTTVRGLSEEDVDCIQTGIRQFYGASNFLLFSDVHTRKQTDFIQLQLGDKAQRVRVDDFVHTFLDLLHGKIQAHADCRISSNAATSAISEASFSNIATSDNNVATFDHAAAFDDEFPHLTSSNAAAKTTKRRITTTLLTSKDSTVVARPMLASNSFPPLDASESTTKLPAWAKSSLLEKRMATSQTASCQSAWETKKVGNKATPWSNTSKGLTAPSDARSTVPMVKKNKKKEIAWSTDKTSDGTSGLQQVQVKTKSLSSQASNLQHRMKEIHVSNQDEELQDERLTKAASDNSAVSCTDFAVNVQAARLYGFFIKERFVKKTCAELQVVMSLLYRADCRACRRTFSESDNVDNNTSTSLCVDTSEFCYRVHCLDFAELVFHQIESVLMHLGTDLLALVKQSLRDAQGICSDMLVRLDQVSRQREELRVAESARIGCQLPVEMKASAVRDFALPFHEEMDSRLHYRTPAESLLYTNREKIRDGFLSLLRQFQQKQHSLVGIENAKVAATAITAARELLTDVFPENRWWFAKFFVQELVQVGSNPFGESDKDLVLKIMEDKLVVKNPDRLRKLHRRFSSQKPSNKSPQSHLREGNGSSNNTNKISGNASSSCQRKNRSEAQATDNNVDATRTFTATLDRMKSFFTDNQLFFFHFLHSCDSYEFSKLVKHQLTRRFYAICEATAASRDARKDFTEVVLRLKVVAKFLGYLRFSPQWQVTCSLRHLSESNAAFKALEREGIDTLEVARDSGLDVKQLLEQSILQASISKCIPWLCDYLSMLSLDRLSSGTTYFKQLVSLLQLLYRSPRLDALGETGLYIAMQIERVFHVLHISSDYRLDEGLPSSQVGQALACEHKVLPQESRNGTGEDHLPFLYSQVFVQSCVSELDDLRGFIQTRAQSLPRRKISIGSGTMAARQPAGLIRKLRPLQVVLDSDHGVDTAFSYAIKPGSAVHAVSRGTKSSATTLTSNVPTVQEEHGELSDAVFKTHPRLKSVVDFVVGTVTTDVCEHVILHIVTPRADTLVNQCAAQSGLLHFGNRATRSTALDKDSALAAQASFQMLLTSKTRHEANSTVVAALQDALCLGEERVRTAVPLLLPPSSHPTLINSIVSIALQHIRSVLKALVSKSSQTEFVKRIAFRNQSLLKELGSALKVAIAAPPSSATRESTTRSSIAVHHTVKSEQQYRELRRCVAAITTSANDSELIKSSLAEWELEASRLSQSVSLFTTSLNNCAVTGVLTHDPESLLSVSALVLWDIVWRGITSCLKFLRSSLELLAAREVPSLTQERVTILETVYVEYVTSFSALLEAVVHCVESTPDNDLAVPRLQSMLEYVMKSMMELPSSVFFAVRANSLVAAKLRVVMSKASRKGTNFELEAVNQTPAHFVE